MTTVATGQVPLTGLTTLHPPFATAERTEIEVRGAEIMRDKKLRRLTGKWTSREMRAFQDLQQSAQEYFEARIAELDLNGLGGTARYIRGTSDFESELVNTLEQLEQGHLPHFSDADFTEADARLNAVYAEVLKRVDEHRVAA